MKLLRFTLRQLQYLVAIAEANSLSEAAARLHVSQPALSQALTELERALGVQLVLRARARGVKLTASGNHILAEAREIVRLAGDIQEEGGQVQALQGTLAIGCYISLAPTALPGLLDGFSALHPALDLQFYEDNQDVVQERLLDGELDLAILYDMEIRPELACMPMASVRPHVLLPADHPRAADDVVWLGDLEPEPMILLDVPPSARNTLAMLRRVGLTPVVRYRPRSFELARSLVGRGMGYAFMYQRPAPRSTYEGLPVVTKEIGEQVDNASVLIAWPSSMRLNKRAERFAEYCVANYDRLDGT